MAVNNQTGPRGLNDLKGTFIAGAVPEITKFIVNHFIPDEIFNKYLKGNMGVIKLIPPGIGLLIKQITHLTPEQDAMITDVCQELGQSLELRKEKEEIKEEAHQKGGSASETKTTQQAASIIDILGSADQKVFKQYIKKLMELLASYDNQEMKNDILLILSGLEQKKFLNFMSLSLKDQRNFLKEFLMKPEVTVPKEDSEDAWSEQGSIGKKIVRLRERAKSFYEDSKIKN